MKGEICSGAGVVGTAPAFRSSQRGSSEAEGSGSPGGRSFSVAEERRPRPEDAGGFAALWTALGRSCFLAEFTCLSEGSFFPEGRARLVVASSGSRVDRAAEGAVPSSPGSGRSSPDCTGFRGAVVTLSSRLSLLRLLLPSAPEGKREAPEGPASPSRSVAGEEEKRHLLTWGRGWGFGR